MIAVNGKMRFQKDLIVAMTSKMNALIRVIIGLIFSMIGYILRMD